MQLRLKDGDTIIVCSLNKVILINKLLTHLTIEKAIIECIYEKYDCGVNISLCLTFMLFRKNLQSLIFIIHFYLDLFNPKKGTIKLVLPIYRNLILSYYNFSIHIFNIKLM